MTDQYIDQYRKETAQVHAPADLIMRTKAAVRAEEERLRRADAARPAASEEGKGLTTDFERITVPVDAKRFDVRKWTYPLTAAAALLILVSVSLMARGIKSGNTAPDSAVYEETAMETESAEMADGGMAGTGAAAGAEESTEAVEEAFADEAAGAEMDMAVAETETEDMPAAAAADDALSEESELRETKQNEQQKALNDTEKSLEKEAQSRDVADAENITIEKVDKEPDFCRYPDTQTRVFKGETFQIAKIENEWAAYVEIRDGSAYLIRGEAADMETFLEMGYQELYSNF